jgi:osmotically-inducible protein OsmY
MTWSHHMKTDSQLQQDVMAELQWEPAVHSAQIGVQAKDGVVTLAGEVHSWSERDLTKRSAWGSSGVRTVVDKMSLSY